MKMLHKKPVFYKPFAWLSFLFLLVLTGCAPSTQITGTWVSPQTRSTTYDRIIVAALTENTVARQTLEAHLQTQLMNRGIKATKSIDIFPPELMRNEGTNADQLLTKIKGDGHDAILTVAIVDSEVETRYVPGTAMYAPVGRFGWYNSFRGYYGHMRPLVYDPGYYREEKVYFLETNLYDANTDALLWSAQSQSYNPSGLQRFSEKLAALTVQQMQKDRLIK